MLLPRSHSWTPLQKWLILGGLIGVMVVFSGFVYVYERHYRGPTDNVLFGTWQRCEDLFGVHGCSYYRLDSDHTFRVSDELGNDYERGIWYAGGDFLYFRRPFHDAGGNVVAPLDVWRLEAISSTQLSIRDDFDARVHTLNRVNSVSP
jgi:hypothetical protein